MSIVVKVIWLAALDRSGRMKLQEVGEEHHLYIVLDNGGRERRRGRKKGERGRKKEASSYVIIL
jgi:hypothetical protein